MAAVALGELGESERGREGALGFVLGDEGEYL
jgi:hypothetical protein